MTEVLALTWALYRLSSNLPAIFFPLGKKDVTVPAGKVLVIAGRVHWGEG